MKEQIEPMKTVKKILKYLAGKLGICFSYIGEFFSINSTKLLDYSFDYKPKNRRKL